MATFALHGQELQYIDAPYNNTRVNERAVEVAAALHLIAKAESVLEVGCVMPHYLPNIPNDSYTVVDLYEQFPPPTPAASSDSAAGGGNRVKNEDVLTHQPDQHYDLVLCISTLDHLQSPTEVLAALRNMKQWRTLGGLLLVTLPFGQPAWIGGGPWLDALLGSRFQMGASLMLRMDKVDPWHHLWAEVEVWPDHPPGKAYNGASAWANTVYFLLYGDVERWWNQQPFPFRTSSKRPSSRVVAANASSASSS